MRFLWTRGRNLRLRGLWHRLLRLGRSRRRLSGSGESIFGDHMEQHHHSFT